MSELITTHQLGDIRFGIPSDTEKLNKPWSFYEFLGVSRRASVEKIKKAYKRLAIKLHPDKEGDEAAFKILDRVTKILLDDGGRLGKKHSQRRQYDQVSSYDSYFDGYIEYKGERTKKFSEIILIRRQSERERAEVENKLSERYSEFRELRQQFKKTRSIRKKREIARNLEEIAMKDAGFDENRIKDHRESKERIHKSFSKKTRKICRRF